MIKFFLLFLSLFILIFSLALIFSPLLGPILALSKIETLLKKGFIPEIQGDFILFRAPNKRISPENLVSRSPINPFQN